VNANLERMANASSVLRLEPPEPLPDSFTKRFPELKPWEQRNLEIWKRNVAEIGRQIEVARTAPKG